MPKLVFLWTDIAFFAVVLSTLFYGYRVSINPNLKATWRKVAHNRSAMCAAVVLMVFLVIAVLDSIHYRPVLPTPASAPINSPVAYATTTKSLLDNFFTPLVEGREKTYSAPLAIRQFAKETELINGQAIRHRPLLRYGGRHLSQGNHGSGQMVPTSTMSEQTMLTPEDKWVWDVIQRLMSGLFLGVVFAIILSVIVAAILAEHTQQPIGEVWQKMATAQTAVPWRAMLLTCLCLSVLLCMASSLSLGYHVMGTDQTGNNVLVQALKSVRTALVIGSLTTLATLPFALVFGLMAGYFKGWVDDLIQYVYTTLTSIPGVLLIAACILMIQVFIDQHPDWFVTSAERADLRLFLLCLILGLTGWAGLCRLLRAETLKLRELDYVQAAKAFGVGHYQIIARHLLPNVMHIVLITVVLEFSGLVLYEAVLSYLGVGVDPQMNSFGSMINLARSELSRSPVIWWNITTAFVFMLTLVLAANLFADAVRDAFDPRTRRFRPSWLGRRAQLTSSSF